MGSRERERLRDCKYWKYEFEGFGVCKLRKWSDFGERMLIPDCSGNRASERKGIWWWKGIFWMKIEWNRKGLNVFERVVMEWYRSTDWIMEKQLRWLMIGWLCSLCFVMWTDGVYPSYLWSFETFWHLNVCVLYSWHCRIWKNLSHTASWPHQIWQLTFLDF